MDTVNINDNTNRVNIVLVNPQIPQNTGNIARTCAATNSPLHIIKPMGFTIDDKKLKRAGLDYWHDLDITYYENIDDFFDKTNGEYYYFTTKALNIYSNVSYKGNVFLLFGREDAGLDENLLYQNKDYCVRVPMVGDTRSLNLSNTVALATYEVLRQWNFENLNTQGSLTKFDW